jgi:hypothetical protein
MLPKAARFSGIPSPQVWSAICPQMPTKPVIWYINPFPGLVVTFASEAGTAPPAYTT